MKRVIAILFIAALAVLLLYVVAKLPPMGDPQSPSRSPVATGYLENAQQDTGSHNVVTAVNINYRGYDTLGKVAIIFCALTGVLALLGRERKGRAHAYIDLSTVRSSIIVRTMVRFIVPFILLFSVYIILQGEITPGGGFQGGAIIGASMIIFTAIFGLWESSRRIPQKLRVSLEGTSILTFFVIGVLGLIGGGNFLAYTWPDIAENLQPTVTTWLTMIAEIGIGVGFAAALISILVAMLREEGENAIVA